MGHLNQVVKNVNNWIKRYDLKNYVETGTGKGECIGYALDSSFQNLFSIEIHKRLFLDAEMKFNALAKIKKKNCEILHGSSFERLPEIFKKLKGNTLFFLDAHFPGVAFGYSHHGNEPDYNTRLPCEKEIETISSLRDTTNDIIIIDDLRLYEPGQYEGGPNPISQGFCPTVNSNFLYKAFDKTHDLTIDYQSQGYMIIIPKRKRSE